MNRPFAAALLEPTQAVPQGLCAWNGSDPTRRLAVYRNNVLSSLIDALADLCPVVQALVGEEFFRAMAGIHVRQSPPRSPVLAHYGGDFPAFIEAFEPARSVRYLADVARLELARRRAQNAADTEGLTAERAQAALSDPQRVPELRLRWHPSVTLLRSRYAVASLWAAHQTEGEPELEHIDPDQPQSALVLRHAFEVLVLPVSPASARFIEAGLDSAALGDAVAAAMQVDAAFDLTGTLGPLLSYDALTGIELPTRNA